MKKILLWSSLALMTLVSCNKDLENNAPSASDDLVSFVATVGGAETRTLLEGTKNYWNGTEEIRLFDGKISKVFKAENLDKVQTATFTETKPEEVLEAGDYLAVYPAGPSGSVSWDGNVESPLKKMWLSDSQAAVEGSYDPAAHAAVAYAENETSELTFKNVLALLKFTVGSDDVKEVSIKGNNGEKLSGNYDILYNNGEPTADASVSGYYTLDYGKVTGTFVKGKTYYMAVFPGAFTKGISVYFNNNLVRQSSASVTISRNVVYNLGTLELPDMAAYSWSVIGLDNDWTKDYDMTLEGDWFVAKELTITTGDSFKIRANKGWDISFGGDGTAFADGEEYAVGKENVTVAESGIYDVYLSKDAKKIKVVKVGEYVPATPAPTAGNLYLQVSAANWKQGNERFAAYFYIKGTDTHAWVSMTAVEGFKNYYECTIPTDNAYDCVILCRMNGSATLNDWSSRWDQTADLDITTHNCYNVTSSSNGKASGEWLTLE